MALSCDDPGLLIRQPLGDCMLRIFNYYVEESHKLDSLESISKFDVVRFYRSTFPHKRDKDPALYESAIAELVKERHPVISWDETHQILQTFVHLAFSKLTEDETLQKELLSLPDDLQHAYVDFFKNLSTTEQDGPLWDMLYCKKCMEEQEAPKYQSPPKRLKRNLSIKEFCGSPQFKRQQEKTQQAKRVLELENEIDERNYALDAKSKEVESLTKTLKELQHKDAERRKAQNDQSDEFLSLKSEKQKLEQDNASLQLKLESASKRHKREIEEVESRAQSSAVRDFQEVVSGLEKKIRDAEKAERDALRNLQEREVLCNQLREEMKSASQASEQSAETISQLEQSLTDARSRLREQEETLQELQALSGGPKAPGTPLSKYLEKDLQSELQEAKKKIDYLRADVELYKGSISDLEKETFETKAALTRAEDEIESLKNRLQLLSAKNVDLARESTLHKVRGEVLEEENQLFSQQIQVLKEDLHQMTNKEMLQSLKREEIARELAALQSKSVAEIATKDALIAEIRAQDENLEEEISSLNSELEEANARCTSEHERRSEVTIALAEKERRLSEADSRIAFLEESLLSSQKKTESLKSDLESESAKFKECDETRLAEIQAVKAKNSKIQTELSQNKKEFLDLKAALVDASTHTARLEGEVAAKAHEMKNFEHALRVKLDVIQETESKLARALEEGAERDREAEAKVQSLTTDLALLEREKVASENDLRAQLSAVNQKVSTLVDEKSEIQSLLDAEFSTNKTEVAGLKKALTEAENVLETTKQLSDSARAQLSTKVEETGSLSLQIEYLTTKMEKTERAIEKTRQDHAEEIKKKSRDVDAAKSALDAWTSRFGHNPEDTENAILVSKTELDSSVERENELLENVDALQLTIQAIRSDLASRDAILDEWKRAVGDNPAAGESKISQLVEKLRESEVAVQKGVDELRGKEAVIGRWEMQVKEERERQRLNEVEAEKINADLKSQLEAKVTDWSKATNELSSARGDLEALANNLSEITRKQKQSDDEVNRMRDVLAERETKIADAQTALAQAVDERDKLRTEKANLEESTKETVNSLKKRQEELATGHEQSALALRNDLETRVAEMVNLSRKLKDVEEALRLKSAECDNVHEKLENSEKRVYESGQRLVQSEAEKETALGYLKTQMEAIKEELASERVQSDVRLAEKQQEMNRMVSAQEEKIKELEAKISEDSESLRFNCEELSEAKRERAEVLAELQVLKSNLATHEGEMTKSEALRESLLIEKKAKTKELEDLKVEAAAVNSRSEDLTESLEKEIEIKAALKEKLESAEDQLRKLENSLEEEREKRVKCTEEAESERREKEVEIVAMSLEVQEAGSRITELSSKAAASEERCKVLEDQVLKDAENVAAALRADVAATKQMLRDEKDTVEKLNGRLDAAEKDADQLRAELEAAQSAALGFKKAEEELKERAEEEIADLKAEVERGRQLGIANDENASEALKESQARFVEEKAALECFLKEGFLKEKAELEERAKRIEDDFAVEKELLEATNSRHIVNLEKDKKKLEKKLLDLTKTADETAKNKDQELNQLKDRLAAFEVENEEMVRKVEELTIENEALMWGGMEKDNSPEPRGRTFVKDERDPVAGNLSLRSQVSGSSLSGQPPQPRLSSSRKSSQVDLRSQKSSSSLKSSSSNFAVVNELEEDFLGTPIAIAEETVKRRETMAFGEEFKEQLLAEDNDDERRRLAELKRRNTLVPSHLQSSYPVETSYCARKINESTLQRGQDTPTTRSKAKSAKTSPGDEQQQEAPSTNKEPPVAMEFSPPGRAGGVNSNRRESLAHAQTSEVLQFSPGPLQGKKGPRRVPRRLGAFSEPKEPSPVAEVRPMTSVHSKTATKSFKPFQRVKPEDDMFEIITQATGHRIEDQVYDKPLLNQEHSHSGAPPRPSPPSKTLQKRKKVDDLANNENTPAASSAGPTPTKKPKKGLTGTPMKMLSNLKINTPKTKLKLKGNVEKASSSGPHLRQEASALARSQESLNSVGTPSAANSTSQSLDSLTSVEGTESSFKKGFSLRRKGSNASATSQTSASSQGSEDEGKKKKSMRRSIMSIMK